MSIAVYIRVSSHSQTLDSQRSEIERYLRSSGEDLDNVLWISDKETGSTLSRNGFKQLEKGIFSGEIKTVIVWKLDRLARSLKDGVAIISDWCDKGVRIVSVTQQLDLSGTVGRLIASVLFGLAEMELEHIRERQASGIALAKEKGIYTGRKSGTFKASPTRAKELKSQGLKNKEIAQALGVSLPTISTYLKD